MRKILNIILAACLGCCALTSCGSSANEKDNKVNENVNSITIKISDEILEADPDSRKIQIANTVMTLPISLEELIALGATTNININSEILETNRCRYIDIKIDGMSNRILFCNSTDANISVKDSTFEDVLIPLDFICPKGIKKGSSIDDVIEKYGEPESINLNKYRFEFDSCVYTFTINLETNIINNIEYYIKG